MAILFFEGFNYTDANDVKLNPYHWTTNNSSKISYESARTDSAVVIAPRPIASGLEYNTTLTLSNFIDPLISHSGFGLGFGGYMYRITTNNNSAPAPYAENFISFHDDTDELLRIDIIKTTYESANSLGFGIYQNNTLIDTYDLKSVPGHSWNIQTHYDTMTLAVEYYFEIYIDSTNENKLAIRLTASNTVEAFLKNTGGNMYTNITGFTNLKSIKFYSTNNALSYSQYIDDLYLTGGNDYATCLLGHNTKIYRLVPNEDGAPGPYNWLGRNGGSITSQSYSYIDDNDGDDTYIFSSTSGNQSFYGFGNLSGSAPSGIGGIQVINIARNQSVDNAGFINIVTDADNTPIVDLGSGYTVNSDQYKHYSQFVYTNPLTSTNWTTDDINNIKIGVKHLGSH